MSICLERWGRGGVTHTHQVIAVMLYEASGVPFKPQTGVSFSTTVLMCLMFELRNFCMHGYQSVLKDGGGDIVSHSSYGVGPEARFKALKMFRS